MVCVFINTSNRFTIYLKNEMQIVIVNIIIIVALVYTALNIYRIFQSKTENSCGCSGCDINTDVQELKSLSKKLNIK